MRGAVVPQVSEQSPRALLALASQPPQCEQEWRQLCPLATLTLCPCPAAQVKRQSAQAWQFILDREIEAPARFQAIQTQRAAAAILRQQARPCARAGRRREAEPWSA